MSANVDPNNSTIAAAVAALSSTEKVVKVTKTTGGDVVVKWGESAAQETTGGLSDNCPQVFKATSPDGFDAVVPTFGTLLRLHGGTLEIVGTIYRIVYRNPGGSSGVPRIHQNLEDFPSDRLKPFMPGRLNGSLERYHHVLNEKEQGVIYYSRELHLQINVENLMKDIIRSCSYDLRTDSESSLNGLKIDIGVLRNSSRQICGTTDVKQPHRPGRMPPDPEPMTHPKVVAQVASQMIPLRTLYGLKEVYGILSTYKEWRFFKYELEEEDENVTGKNGKPSQSDHPFKTPQKRSRPERKSHPMSPRPCTEEECGQEEKEEKEAESAAPLKRGVLYASHVVPAGQPALEMLTWIMAKMSESEVETVQPHNRDFLYVVRKGDTLGGYERLKHRPDCRKYSAVTWI